MVNKITEQQVAEVKQPETSTVNYTTLPNEVLMDELFKRGIDIPMSDDGKLVRKVAVQKLLKWEEAAKPLNSYRKMRVVFHRSGRESEAPYVFLSLNGVAYQAPYEKEVELPEPVIRACVDNATIDEMEFTGEIDGQGRAIYKENKIKSHPYTFLGYVEESKDN